jgi:hypothetical protein
MKRIVALLGAVAMVVCWRLPYVVRAQNSAGPALGEIVKQADAAWSEKSYQRALDLYRQAQQQGAVRDGDEVQYRIAVALGKTEKWDEALTAAEALLAKTTWKARVLYWMGQLYTKVPHQAYKVGGKTYRGQDYPKTDGAEKPQQVWLAEEDAAKTLEYFERAKVAAPRERDFARRASFGHPAHPLSLDEEIDLNFDLAAYLPTREYTKFIEAATIAYNTQKPLDQTVDTHQPYDPGWHLAKKALYLYNQIRDLDGTRDHHKTVMGLYSKGFFVRSYRQIMDNWASWYDPETKTRVHRPYPFENLDAIAIWRSIVEEFPRDPLAPQTQILIAQTYAQQGDSVKALAAYRVVPDQFPMSKWVNDARASIQQILKQEVGLNSLGQQPPGQPAKLNVYSRNVKRVEFTAYRVKLEDVLTQADKLSDWQTQFTQFNRNFGSIDNARRYFGPQVAAWTLNTQDKGNYQGVSETIDTPLQQTGAYVIVARANDRVHYAQVLIISDLAVLKKLDRDTGLAFVADARTGRPVIDANVVIKEIYHEGSIYRTDVARGQSSEMGLFEKKLVRGANFYSENVQVLAWSGDRYAITGAGYYGYYGYGDNRDERKVYSYTDRPVYRPGQKVYFRQILTRRVKGGDQEPVKDEAVQVTIRNPRGETIFDQKMTSSEFGTVNGEFDLPAETPLGEYYVQAYVAQTVGTVAFSGGNRFRVEEYKRPEFQVNVEAPEQAVRPGETVAAKVNLKYYFGAPVPDAKVKYTVRRSTWWAGYEFPRPFAWLYRYWNVGDYNTGRRNIGGEGSGAIVKEGTVTTDAQGNAEVTFQAVKDTVDDTSYGWWWRRYANPLYTIQIEATDASRRTIEGQGAVRVANQQYFAFLDAKRGYYLAGDHVEIEVVTQDANNRPVAATGKMVVYRLVSDGAGSQAKEEKLHEEPVQVDDKGHLFWTWQPDVAGRFRIAYEATDAWGQPVNGSTEIWVGGAGLDTAQFHLQGVTIVLEKRYYEEGDTLKALLVADQPDTTLLFTQEAGGEILKRDVIHIDGRSKEITIPITHEHVPNFMLAAAMVKNFEVYQAQEEVFVPPARQLINVEVQGAKAEYMPGEKGTFTIKATDWQGKPARAEVSLALTDASLFYIQKDYAPDIRLFYYGERRANSVNLDSHRSGNMQGFDEDTTDYAKYETHTMDWPDDLGQLNLPPGGFRYGYGSRVDALENRVSSLEVRHAGAVGETGAMGPMGAPILSSVPGNIAVRGGVAERDELAAKAADQQLAQPQVRSNFAETAFWSPAVVTDNGQATVEVTFPDSLTRWHALARGLTTSTQVGAGDEDVVTKKNLLVRLQAPRFFVERDTVVLSANVHNYLKTDKRVKVSLHLEGVDGSPSPLQVHLQYRDWPGGAVTGVGMTAPTGMVDIKAGEEKRVNWIVDVTRDGKASVQMTAQTDEEADAVKMEFPVLVHGVQRFTAQAGVLREGSGKTREVITVKMPKERRFGASNLNVQLNPSLAATMLDALPYLMDYPYGCVEQTMSRFLPSVVTAKVLSDSGVNLQTLGQRARAYEAEAKAQAIGTRVNNTGYTYPTGMPNSRDLTEMSSRLWHTPGRGYSPIYDKKTLDAMVNEGLERLYAMQRSDGGWGWWQGSGSSDEYMSAYVVYGLATAKAAEVKVRDDVLERGYSYLQRQMKDEDNIHLLTWIAFALSQRGRLPDDVRAIVAGRLFEQRERLTAYSQSLLALTLWNTGEKEKAGVLVRNLENTAKVDDANGTARWRLGIQWWYWWNNDVETNAWALRAFLQINPDNRLTPMLMKWLTLQMRGNHWRSTKETAMAVYALADYVRVNKELDVDYTVTVNLNGKLQRTYHVTSDNALFFDNRFITGDLFLENGDNKLTIEKQGKGNLYWSAASEYFSLEEPIKAAGNEIAIKRRYFKLTRNPQLTPEQGDGAAGATVSKTATAVAPPRPVDSAPTEYVRTEIKDGDQLQSGDLVEVELILDSANDYSYLVFEDMKPAGMEPVELRSGAAWGDGLCSNVELRDEKVALFVDRLPQGTRVLRYRMRAEIPGSFHALPTNGYAMYAPEVRAISDEQRMGIHD